MTLTRSAPLVRRTPLRSKRPTPRRILTPPELQCRRKRCTALGTILGWCPMHAKLEADRLFSLYVRHRDGRCLVCGDRPKDGGVVGLQCMHGESRAKYATRWDPSNAWAGCLRCHYRFTNNPAQWELWRRERIGDEAFNALRFKAERGGMSDVGWVIGELRRWLSAMGVAA